MRVLIRIIDGAGQAAAILAALALAGMGTLMLAEIVARSFLGFSIGFSWEFSAYMLSATFFLGMAYALRTGGHVRVSLLAEMLPEGATKALDILCTVAGIVIAAYVAQALTGLAMRSFADGARSFMPSRTPLYIPQTVTAIGAWLLVLQLVGRLLRLLTGAPPDDRLASDSLSAE